MRIRRATHLSRRSPLPCLGLVSTLSLACGITPLLTPAPVQCVPGAQDCPGTGGAGGTSASVCGVANGGYVIAGRWQGYAWTAAATENGSTITPKDFSALAAGSPLCVSGSVAAQYDWGGYAMIGVNLNQSLTEGAPENSVVPTGAGVTVDVTNTGGSQLRVQISGPNGATDPNDRWCVPIGGKGGFIPWGSFNTACWGGYGNAYRGEPITQIAILVPGSNSVAVPFNFCINCIVESTGSPTGGTGGGGAISAGGAPAGSPVELHGQLRVLGTKLVDQQNQPTQLKGPSSMWLNWENQRFAEDKQGLQWMRDNWNASLIRAAMGVAAGSPTDYFDAPAIAKAQVNQIVQNAIDLGVYVIIDWHEENADSHQQEAIAFFTEMAQTWGIYPNVIYEPFNEPTYQDWSTVLKPYHQAVVDAIRAVDPDNLIVLGTPTWSQDVDVAASDPVSGSNLLYTLHFYSCTHRQPLRDKANTALSLGAALFVTEWGATDSQGGTPGNPTLCLDEAQRWHDWMNTNKISWAAWKFDRCVDTTCYFNPNVMVPTSGGWTDAMLYGHGPFVRDRMKE
jgi:endoglucanase